MAIYVDLIVKTISGWGYWAVAIGMALESACLPVPSEVVLPFAGYLVSRGELSWFQAISAGLLGGMVGSVLAYTIGRIGGRPFVLRYGRRLFISKNNLSRAERWVDKYGDRAAFWSRFVPIVRTFVSLPLGVAQMPFPRFVAYSFAGSIPWTIALIYAGKTLGQNWDMIRVYGDWVNMAIILALSVGAVVFCIKHYRGKRNCTPTRYGESISQTSRMPKCCPKKQ